MRDLAAPPVVSQASFTLRRGEILGIAGLMGSGRTEMVRGLFGLAPVASGTVRIAGVTAGPAETPSRRIAQRVGYLSEDRKGEGLAMPMSVADFHHRVLAELAAARIDVAIHPTPNEVEDAIPFAEDTVHAAYDRAAQSSGRNRETLAR